MNKLRYAGDSTRDKVCAAVYRTMTEDEWLSYLSSIQLMSLSRRRHIGKQYRNIFKQLAAENREFVEKSRKLSLMDPECTMGYTMEQVTRIMGARLYDFRGWMQGQTGSICDGRQWNHETEAYEPTGCGPHGIITYRQDVERFLLGLPVVD